MLQWLRYDCLFLHDVLSYSLMVFVCTHGSNFWGTGRYGWGGLDLVTNFRSTIKPVNWSPCSECKL